MKAGGRRIALVPTMGNLHEGHLALVRRAAELVDATVVSIFVNPSQFSEGEDFTAYPRTFESDLDKLGRLSTDLLFVPEVRDIYPRGPELSTRVEVPELGGILCGASRPTFFRGVATVVNMLLNLVQPHVVLFGEKDYQQLLVVRRMVGDLRLPVEVESVPTVREADGLAMSSRNQYLDSSERARAPRLYASLLEARRALRSGDRDYHAIGLRGMRGLEGAGFRPDYFAVRRAADLGSPEPGGTDLVVLAAAWLGTGAADRQCTRVAPSHHSAGREDSTVYRGTREIPNP